MTFELAFVDSIATTPTVRLSLTGSAAGWHTLDEGTDFGVPSMRRAFAGTLLTDGQIVPAAAYDNRVLTLHLDIGRTVSADDAATLVQSLGRELERPTNILRYRPGTTEPVFFRTFRGGLEAMEWDGVNRRASVRILAEPFAYGPEVTQSGVVVTNDPAAVSNGCYLDVTGVKGDVETPAKIKLVGLNGGARADVIIGTRRRGTPSSGVYFYQAEAMVSGSDTSQLTDAIMSGSSSNYQRTTFASQTLLELRLYVNTGFPASSGVDLRGTYRVYAMLRGPTTGVFSLQWQLMPLAWAGGAAGIQSPVISYTPLSSTLRSLVDLGQITLPVGADPVTDGYSGVEKSITGGQLFLYAGRTSGTGSLDWDYIVLVPDDPARGDDFFSLSLYNAETSVDVVLDGPRDMVYPQDIGTSTIPVWYSIPWTGRIPKLTPNQTNRLIVLRPDRAGTDATYGDTKGRTTTVTVSYWPRYLSVRPLST